jgi:hypothetical protein
MGVDPAPAFTRKRSRGAVRHHTRLYRYLKRGAPLRTCRRLRATRGYSRPRWIFFRRSVISVGSGSRSSSM